MKVTIEPINHELCTVVWNVTCYDFGDGNNIRSVMKHCRTTHGYALFDGNGVRVGQALFAVPKTPDIKRDERLWHAYAAEGLRIAGNFFSQADEIDDEDSGVISFPEKLYEGCDIFHEPVEEVTHATLNGVRVEIAIADQYRKA